MNESIHADVFNGAMKSIYRELEEIKALLEKREDAREADIRSFALVESRINYLMEKQANFSKIAASLFGGVGVLFVWRLIETISKK